MSLRKKIRAAIQLYRDFRERVPKRIRMLDFEVPQAVMVIGHVDEILYTTTHGKKVVSYRHPFQDGSRPLLCASSDGRQLMLFGGRYKFTDRGIVDRDAEGNLVFDPDHGANEGVAGLGPGFMRRRQANPARTPEAEDRWDELGPVTKRLDDWLVGAGYDPLSQAQIDALYDPARAAEAAAMLEDLEARVVGHGRVHHILKPAYKILRP